MERAQTQESSNSRSSSSYLSSSSVSKYGGLIDITIGKQIKSVLMAMMAFVDQTVPPLPALHLVISIIRCLQLVGPAFIPSYDNFMGKSTAGKVLSIVSILFHVVPASYRENHEMLTTLIGIILFALFFIIVIVSGWFFRRDNNIPRAIPFIIAIFQGTFGYVLPPIMTEMVGEWISRCIHLGRMTRATDVVVAIIAAILILLYMYFYDSVGGVSLLFKYDSLMTVEATPQFMIIASTQAVTLLTSCGSYLSDDVQMILLILSALLYSVPFLSIYKGGAYISSSMETFIMTVSFYAPLVLIADIVFNVMKIQYHESILISEMAFLLVIFILCANLVSRRRRKILELLDKIEQDEAVFNELIKSPSKLGNVAVIGFIYAHPVCISWKLFNLALTAWPDNSHVYASYAKYVAIYPDSKTLLDNIRERIMSHKIHGTVAKQTVHQIQSLMKQRESELAASLKKRIDKIQKNIGVTKRRMRQVWDLVLAGNTGEMEEAILNTRKSVTKTERDINELARQYPNNRFMMRVYSRFIHEVLGDVQRYQDTAQKSQLLKRGVQIEPDSAHELGLATFPNLPQILHDRDSVSQLSYTRNDTVSMCQTDTEDEDILSTHEIDHNTMLKTQMETVKIPSVRFIRWSFTLAFFICFLLVMIILFILSFPYTNSLLEPLVYIQSLTSMRLFTPYQMLFTQRRCLELMPFSTAAPTGPKFFPALGPFMPGVNLPLYQNSFDPTVHLSYAISRIITRIQDFTGFQNYKIGSPNIDKMRNLMFDNSMKYSYYIDADHHDENNISCLNLVGALSQEASKLMMKTDFTSAVLEDSSYLTIFHNFENVIFQITQALNMFKDYVTEENLNIEHNMLYIQIALSLVIPIVYLIILYFSLKKLQENKMTIYAAIITLPKNVVSTVADQLKVLKQDTSAKTGTSSDSELSKQEENILRVFASASDTSTGGTTVIFVFSFFVVVLMALAVIEVVVFVGYFTDVWNAMLLNSPQFNNVLGSPSAIAACFVNLNAIILNVNGYSAECPQWDKYVSSFEAWLDNANNFFHLMRYGGELVTELPFAGLEYGLNAADKFLACQNPTMKPVYLSDVYRCYLGDDQFMLIDVLVRKVMYTTVYKKGIKDIKPDNSMYNQAYGFANLALYIAFFNPMLQTLTPTITASIEKTQTEITVPIILTTIFALIFTIFVLLVTNEQESQIRFSLLILLNAPSSAILQTPKITQILAGQFSRNDANMSRRDQEYYAQIVEELPDSVVLVDKQNKVVSMNTHAKTYFKVNEEVIGKTCEEFFTIARISGQCTHQPGTKIELDFTPEGDPTSYFTLNIIAGSFNVYIFRDRTPTVKHAALIAEERAKTDRLLGSILPPILIPRVQAGEKNISFSVQSASIVFIDIVEFTPWCGANTATYVMSTLNKLFGRFDIAISKWPTMIRMKCIGDCYMAAGGIFTSVNNPIQHAREACEFGLDAIDIVKEMDKESGFHKEIRCGINTGGPIVAGVLGTAKPTFEILGKPINMAQQMEHHGVPMKVHISRSVYELIYGTGFEVNERGMTEVKEGSVLTYLVTGHTKK